MGADRLLAWRMAAARWPENFASEVRVPEQFRAARLCDFDCVELVRPNDCGLFITGECGSGKSHLAAAWLTAKLPDAVHVPARSTSPELSARWQGVPELLKDLRGTFGNPNRTEDDVLYDLVRVRWLALDDLGAEKSSDWTAQSLYLLLNGRLDRMLPTIVTSNLTLSEINERDPRLASRLGGMGYQKLAGGDRRLGKQEAS